MLHYRPRRSDKTAAGFDGASAQPFDARAAASVVSAPSGAPARLGWLIVWMSGTVTAFIIAAISVRALAHALNPFETMTLRSIGGLAILLAMAIVRPELRRGVRARHMGLQAARNLVHFISQICWTIAITLLPFATVFALEFSVPAFVAILAVLFLRERMTATRASALGVCLIGVLVILRPGTEAFQPATMLMIAGSLLFAIAHIITKKLVVTETTFSIMLWMNLMQLPMNFAGSDPLFFLRLDSSMILPVLGVAFAGLAIHYCLANAFRCGDAIVVIPMDFLRVPLIAVIGWAFYGEHPDIYVFAGAGLIVAGVLWNMRGEAQRGDAIARASRQHSPGVAPEPVQS